MKHCLHDAGRSRSRSLAVWFAAIAMAAIALPVDAQRGGGRGGRGGGGGGDQPQPLPAGAAMPDAWVESLEWRSIGPATAGGRVVDIEVDTNRPSTFWVASANGGIWKTTNNGNTFRPQWQHEGTLSVGDVAVSKSNPDIVWVGSGEHNPRNSVSWGDGVYKSTDGGETWEHMGLRDSYQIGRIAIHPTNPDIVYVGALGRLWGPNEERGVFKTTNGGRMWSKSLYVDERSGVIELQMNPEDPNTLLAAFYERERDGFEGGEPAKSHGPGSGVYKTTDGGANWKKLTNGLAPGDMGRTGISYYLRDPNIVYLITGGQRLPADYRQEWSGVFKSTDGGESWTRVNDTNPRPMYYSQIRVDPNDPDVVYVLGTRMERSVDGGATFNRVDIRTHVDHHALWIDHRDSDHILLGNDGGFYVTYDRMANFEFVSKLPISQFYHVGIDHRRLYNVYGGVQDNGTWGAPSMKLTGQGPDNADWMYLSGGDGFVAFADPNDHNVVYSESQNGSMRWRNLVTGESRTIRPTGLPEDGPGNSFNWKTPMLLSHHNSRIFYTAGRYVFRSLNRGEDLRPISPPINVERQGSGSAVAESPRNPEILYAGTTDGALWVTRNGGAEWTRIDENVGLPGMRWVSSIEASRFAEGRVYVAFDGHRSNDDGPHVYASEDFGATWRPLNANLPANGSTRTLREDLQNPNLLFVGTEFAAFASIDRGQSWTRINNNLPSVAVHEWALHPTSGELIAGTHGRSFWILDIGALRQMSAETVAAGAKLYTPHPAVQWGSRVRAGDNYGNGRFIGENPPAGSIVYYSLAQPADAVALEVLGIDGSTLASLNARNTAGLHRVVWNMRRSGGGPGLEEFEEVGFDDDFEAELQEQQQRGAGERGQRAAGQRRGGRGERGGRGGQARGGRGGRGGGGGGGAPVAPGTYRLRLTVDGQEQNTELVILPDPGDN